MMARMKPAVCRVIPRTGSRKRLRCGRVADNVVGSRALTLPLQVWLNELAWRANEAGEHDLCRALLKRKNEEIERDLACEGERLTLTRICCEHTPILGG